MENSFDNIVRETNRRLFRATSVKLSTQAVEVAQKVFDEESVKLRSVANGSVTITYQYLSQTFVDAAYANGNAIDLKPADGPLIGIDKIFTTIRNRHLLIEHPAILLAAAWPSASDDAYLLNFITSLVQSIDLASKAACLYYPYIFLNDAGVGQSPFPLYGDGESLPRMKAIAQQYDPDGVFQNLASGAFKL